MGPSRLFLLFVVVHVAGTSKDTTKQQNQEIVNVEDTTVSNLGVILDITAPLEDLAVPSATIPKSRREENRRRKARRRHERQGRRRRKKQQHRQSGDAHRRRSLEKQVLVRDRSLALLGSNLDDVDAARILSGAPEIVKELIANEEETTTFVPDAEEGSSWFSLARLAPDVPEESAEGDAHQLQRMGSALAALFGGTFQEPEWESPEGSGEPLGAEDTRDPCLRWMHCPWEAALGRAVGLLRLPGCPCEWPVVQTKQQQQQQQQHRRRVWDSRWRRFFAWVTETRPHWVHNYRPGAALCVRSVPIPGTLASQMCCYDTARSLLTRGSGAGTPLMISPEAAPDLHTRLDLLPWRLCKGDFTRFNSVRPPNNSLRCKANPGQEEFRKQIRRAKQY